MPRFRDRHLRRPGSAVVTTLRRRPLVPSTALVLPGLVSVVPSWWWRHLLDSDGGGRAALAVPPASGAPEPVAVWLPLSAHVAGLLLIAVLVAVGASLWWALGKPTLDLTPATTPPVGASAPSATWTVQNTFDAMKIALSVVAGILIPTNPAAAIRLRPERPARPLVWTPPRVDRWRDTGEVPGPVMVWTPEQTGAFLDHAATHAPDRYPLFHLIAHCGLRRGETVGLRDTDTELDRGELAITQQVTTAGAVLQRKPPKSHAGNRVIALDAGTVTVLRAYRAVRPSTSDSGLFFVRPDAQPWHPNAVSRRFRQMVAGAGLPPVLHDLRHGAATLALAAGVELKVVQAILGHSTMKLTADTYASVLPLPLPQPQLSPWQSLDEQRNCYLLPQPTRCTAGGHLRHPELTVTFMPWRSANAVGHRSAITRLGWAHSTRARY